MEEEAGQQARRRLRFFFFLIYFFLYLFHKSDSISPRSLAILSSTYDAFLCANSPVRREKQASSARPSQCTAAYHTREVKHAASLKTLEKARESKGDSKSWLNGSGSVEKNSLQKQNKRVSVLILEKRLLQDNIYLVPKTVHS